MCSASSPHDSRTPIPICFCIQYMSFLFSPFPHPSTQPPAHSHHMISICPQSSTTSTSFLKDCLLKLVGTLMSRSTSSPAPNLMSSTSQSTMPSLTTLATAVKHLGCPPSTRMHPEKRACCIAAESHREKLEKMENIVKGQRGQASISTSYCTQPMM